MVVDKLFEFIEDIERFCVNHKWSRFFNDWESGDEALDDYAMIYKNCCNDVDEEKDAANDIFTELTEYMDCLYNYVDVDYVKLLDDEKQNARKWLDKVEKVIGSCVFSLKGNDLKGFLIKGYQMCHLIKEAAVKTPDEYYGGRRTDVMPYYIGESTMNKEQFFDSLLNESSLKEYFFYAPPHNEEDEEDSIIGYIAAVRDYQTQKTKYVDDDGNVCNSKSQAKVFDTKGKADYYSYEHCPEGWTHFVVALKKSDILNEADDTYKAKVQSKWLKGNKLVKDKKEADTFESKTEPIQRINQMKKDGKLNKNAKPSIVKESLFESLLQEEK